MNFWDEKHLLAISEAINKLYKPRTEYLVIIGAPYDEEGIVGSNTQEKNK